MPTIGAGSSFKPNCRCSQDYCCLIKKGLLFENNEIGPTVHECIKDIVAASGGFRVEKNHSSSLRRPIHHTCEGSSNNSVSTPSGAENCMSFQTLACGMLL